MYKCTPTFSSIVRLTFDMVQASFALGWIPGVSVAILENVVAIPHDLAILCVTPLRIFAFFCFTGERKCFSKLVLSCFTLY